MKKFSTKKISNYSHNQQYRIHSIQYTIKLTRYAKQGHCDSFHEKNQTVTHTIEMIKLVYYYFKTDIINILRLYIKE